MPHSITAQSAEILGLDALAWLAGDGAALERFLAASGVDLGALREAAGRPETILAVFDFLLANEDLFAGFLRGRLSISPADDAPGPASSGRRLMRIGIDLGGTKTEILLLNDAGAERWRHRIATPKNYLDLITAICRPGDRSHDSRGSEAGHDRAGDPRHEKFRHRPHPRMPIRSILTVSICGSTWKRALGRAVRLSNDANCFVLSEARDGAAAGAQVAFGVIAGTGLGGGVCIDGRVLTGAHGVGGEWGHIPLPAASAAEIAEAPLCYCGKRGCIETWCCGPALAADFKRHGGHETTAEEISTSEVPDAKAAMARLTDRLARGLATVVNIIDPDVIVLGRGLSNIGSLYRELPPLVERYAFTLGRPPRIVKNVHGDSSGVRGAAWLWPV